MNLTFNLGKIEQSWLIKAKKMKRTIVFPEAEFSKRVLNVAMQCAEDNICQVVLLTKGNNIKIKEQKNVKVVNILNHEITPVVASAYFVKRAHKGITEQQAKEDVKDVYIFGATMVDLGLVDGMVAGAESPSKTVISTAFKIVKDKEGKKASSFFIMLPQQEGQKAYILADCGAVLNPSAEELADIAQQSAISYKQFIGKTPKVALLSYSTHKSADGESAIKVGQATQILDSRKETFIYDGEIQLDAAINKNVCLQKCPNSALKGDANVLIFPDLQSGNIGYKMMQRFGGFKAVGPVLQGLNRPINDLSRGATEQEIMLSVLITILQS